MATSVQSGPLFKQFFFFFSTKELSGFSGLLIINNEEKRLFDFDILSTLDWSLKKTKGYTFSIRDIKFDLSFVYYFIVYF